MAEWLGAQMPLSGEATAFAATHLHNPLLFVSIF